MADDIQNANAQTTQPAPDAAQLQRELLNERFESVAAKHGLDDSVIPFVAPAAHKWLEQNGRAGTKADLAEYMSELKKSTPRLFAAAAAPAPVPPGAPKAPANTAPVVPNAQPATPAPSALDTPYAQWQALLAAGRKHEAEAFYRLHGRAIARNS